MCHMSRQLLARISFWIFEQLILFQFAHRLCCCAPMFHSIQMNLIERLLDSNRIIDETKRNIKPSDFVRRSKEKFRVFLFCSCHSFVNFVTKCDANCQSTTNPLPNDDASTKDKNNEKRRKTTKFTTMYEVKLTNRSNCRSACANQSKNPNLRKRAQFFFFLTKLK